MTQPNSQISQRLQEESTNPFSQVPGTPSFRNQATNTVALVPLMTSNPSENNASDESFKLLFQSLHRYANQQVASGKIIPKSIEDIVDGPDDMEDVDSDDTSEDDISEVLLVVPTAQLTRPGDWRYEKTPLQNFHWGHGCQRLLCFDGRPDHSRQAHDRLLNHFVTREWIDICPSRRTAAVVGILNLRDIEGVPDGLKKAEAELQRWAERYSTPSYEVSAHGRSFARDGVVQRLFVFDSFQEGNEIDLSNSRLGSNLVAFPPADDGHTHMMDLHLNVVVNDLAVAIFRQLEIRIRESDTMAKEKSGWRNLSAQSPTKTGSLKNIANSAARVMRRASTTAPPQLLTPLDSIWDLSEVTAKDAEAMRRRDIGRREKMAADLSLLAGSPMDAYERYSKAAELAKQSPDPLWYAAALEGCAAAHVSMAEAGGYNVDAYLENNFQLPEEFMAVAHNPSNDGKKTSTPKQTLPAVICALCEEALLIYNRHPSLGAFHAEVLLKLASYTAISEEGHSRCRWGEGRGCYGGDPGEPRRWDKTSAAVLTFGKLVNKDGDDLITLSSLQRTQKFCDFLNRAVSTGSLDALTRADVAAACTRLCLFGVQSTRWKFQHTFLDGHIIKLPRKAAFFSSIAAEALSNYTSNDFDKYRGSSLWLAASQLYSKDGNKMDADSRAYGWSTLRAVVLHALSKQEDPIMSEAAAELVLILLSEMSDGQKNNISQFERSIRDDESIFSKVSSPIDDDAESVASMSSRRSTMSKYNVKPGPPKSGNSKGFFSNTNQPTHALVAQARWAEDAAIPLVKLPLIANMSGYSIANSLLTLKAVLPKIDIESCASAQMQCINQINELRKGVPTLSIIDHNVNPLALLYSGETAPLSVESAAIVTSASHLLLERTKAHGFSGKATGVMATFFNPFDKEKKQAEKKIAATLVAEGEERAVEIEFENHLSLPLEIPSCELVFDKNEPDRIKAPALSFIVPPKAKKFKVHFPFITIAQSSRDDDDVFLDIREDEGKEEENQDPASPASENVFEVTGIRLTCLSRSFLIPINQSTDGDGEADSLIPLPASVYPRSAKKSSKKKKEKLKPWFEAVPAQPHLLVSFANSQTAIDDGITVPVHLSDGEIFTIPSFRLQNDFGPSGFGLMERLQIIGVGMPGLPDEVLFDTDAAAAAREEEEDDSELEEDDDGFEELMEEDGLPPLKIKASCESLSIKSINDKRLGQGSRVTFQVAATHDMGSQLANGGNVRIRFRYRGTSPDPATEIWRKREVALRIVRVKGPRISSLTFRSDLSWGSSYAELCLSLAQQKSRREMIANKWGSHHSGNHDLERYQNFVPSEIQEGSSSLILNRVGMDQGVHVASNEIVALMAVANETNSTILLSNRKGRVGGFSGSPMPTIRVTSGVSVKIPVVIPRITRINTEDEGSMDIAAELVANTALQWKSVVDENNEDLVSDIASNSNLKVRQGRVRIPSKCLREIISEHQSFCSRICQSPVRVKVNIGRNEEESHISVTKGEAVTAHVEVSVEDWVPKDVIDKCSIVMEFCCARKNAAGTLKREYVWCGLLRRKVDAFRADDLKHHARVIFLSEGAFVVSACAKVSTLKGVEETWWAQFAENVIVS